MVHIYFSHNRESYLPYLKGVTNPNLAYHSKINISKVGERLSKVLAEKGIGSEVDQTDIMGILNKKGLKYPKSYQESREAVQTAMASNKNLEYIIDIHRDSKRKKIQRLQLTENNMPKLSLSSEAKIQTMKKIQPLPVNFIKLWRKNTQGYQEELLNIIVLEIIVYIIRIYQIRLC